MNAAAGIQLGYKFNTGFIRYLGIDQFILSYEDLAGNAPVFASGNALYTNVWISSEKLQLMMGYWKADSYVAARGEPLFQSVSDKDTAFTQKNRNLLTAKLGYTHKIYDDISIGVRLEGYYDTDASLFDYSYSVNITFNRDFFLKKMGKD
jgi:hypothetical protein